MSHYSYHKKVLLEDENKNLFFLAEYSDSSITTFSVARNGRTYEYHPKEWCIINPTGKGIMLTREEMEMKAKEILKREMENHEDFRTRYYPNDPPATLETKCYAGTVFPSGGSVKDMKSFYSCRRTKNAKDWFANHRLRLYVYLYDKYTFKTEVDFTVDAKGMEDIVEANKKLLDLLDMHLNCDYVCRVDSLY